MENISIQLPQFIKLINTIFVLKQEVFCVKKKTTLGKISVAGAKLERSAGRSDSAWFSPLATVPFFLWWGKEAALFRQSVKAMSRLREQRGTMGMLVARKINK